MQVEKVMTRGVQTCSPEDSANRAAQIMWEHDCGIVPIVDHQGRVVAVVTDRDICMAAYTQGKQLTEIPVSIAASQRVISVQPNDSLETAEARMCEHQVRRIPVVDNDGRLCGMLATADLARRIQPADRGGDGVKPVDVAQTVAAVSQPHGSPQPQYQGSSQPQHRAA